MSTHRACWMMDPTQGRTLVAKAALAWALFLTSFLLPQRLYPWLFAKYGTDIFLYRGKGLWTIFLWAGPVQVFVVFSGHSGMTNLEENDPGQNLPLCQTLGCDFCLQPVLRLIDTLVERWGIWRPKKLALSKRRVLRLLGIFPFGWGEGREVADLTLTKPL